MAEHELSEFSVEVGNWHQLPIDSSLSQLEQDLKLESPTGKGPSRKQIRSALMDISVDGPAGEDSPLYSQLTRTQHDETRVSTDTHPVAIYHEIEDLTKAVARARYQNRNIKGEQLAEKALEALVDSLYERSAFDSYTTLQALKEPHVRNMFVQKFHSEIKYRLDAIWSLTVNQSADIAAQNMRTAFPALDALVLILLGNSSSAEAHGPSSWTETFRSIYKNLMSARPKIQESNQDEYGIAPDQIKFELAGHPDLLVNLQKRLNVSRKSVPSEKLKTDYERYLCVCAESSDPQAFKLVHTFLQEYSALSSYICHEDEWEDLQPQVYEELCQYVRELFQDVDHADLVPYNYTEYSSKTANAAFISTLCKHAHDQIRAAIHQPLRLLLAVTYLHYFHLDDAPDLAICVFNLTPQLDAWSQDAEGELEHLVKEHAELPLSSCISTLDIPEFVQAYNRCAPSVFQVPPLSEKQLAVIRDSSRIPSTMETLCSTAFFLRLESQLVASSLIEKCIEEISQQYKALRAAYSNFPDFLSSNP